MEILYPMLSAVFVVVLLLVCLGFLRRKGFAQMRFFGPAKQTGHDLEVIDRLVLTPQHSLHLVRVANGHLLIGLSPSGCSLLQTVQSPPGGEGGSA